jgi:hypothetical protein
MLQRYDVRASDLDRERAVEFLKAHYADGRLRDDELAWRTDAAYRAVGLSELDRLTADLPAFAPPPPVRRPRRIGPAAILLLALAVVLVVSVPPEAWALLLAVLIPIAFVVVVLVAPIAVPLLALAWVIHLVARAVRAQAQPRRRVGWR